MADYNGNAGMRLLKKGQKGFFRLVFSRTGIILLLFLFNLFLLLVAFDRFGDFLPRIFGGSVFFVVIMVIYLLNTDLDPTVKITWLILIMLLPIFGVLFFIYTRMEWGHRAIKRRVDQIIEQTKDAVPQDPEAMAALELTDPGAASLCRYMARNDCHPVFRNTTVTYFPTGEDKWAELLKQLEKAEHFIFLEYFIIDEGLMWGKVLELLAKKAREGVEIRLMYDGTNEFSTLPHSYPKKLQELGIQCKIFSPATPFVSTHYNFRDHRKILVIDGRVAFTGGINLADEYINQKERFGHWKDTAVMLEGEAVPSFTLMFLQMWSITEREPEFDKYLDFPTPVPEDAAGFVLPYGDCPLDADKVGERVYMDILNRAQKYVHIMTPYLILDGELETALKFAAERGVDVTLILPGIPDKVSAWALAKTHYASLLESGVKLYEYTPGFVHAKVVVSDDREGVVGTINLDYRSLYHHFECAAYLYAVPCLAQIEDDFQKTLLKCRKVSKDSVKREKLYLWVLGRLLKAIAPLM